MTGVNEAAGWVENLTRLDSHERPILMTWAQGHELRLSGAACQALSDVIKVPIPGYAYIAMDYTLDWLYAAIAMTEKPKLKSAKVVSPWPPNGELKASGEDVDMLVAWEDDQGPHTVLVEAKGFTSWSNARMESKAARLRWIFSGERVAKFDVHFVLVGPAQPQKLSQEKWPDWMKHLTDTAPGSKPHSDKHRAHFVPIKDPGPRLAIQRCTAEGDSDKDGGHWQLVPRQWSAVAKNSHLGPVLEAVEGELSGSA